MSFLLAGAFVALAAVWAYILRYHPPVFQGADREGRNATNYLFHIVIDRGVLYPAAVIAQEIWELRRKWRYGLVFAMVGKRSAELLSHAIECAAVEALYGLPAEAYAVQEAPRMIGYDWLREMGEDRILVEMLEKLPEARKWVQRNLKVLRRHV